MGYLAYNSTWKLEEQQTIQLVYLSGETSCSIQLFYGDEVVEICDHTSADSVTFTPSASIALQKTTAKQMTATLQYVFHKTGSLLPKYEKRTVTIDFGDVVTPVLEWNVAETPDLASKYGASVQYHSAFVISVEATGQYGAEIKSLVVTVGSDYYTGVLTEASGGDSHRHFTATINADAIHEAGDLDVVATITDSRGYEVEKKMTLSVLPYSAPAFTNRPYVVRCDADGTENDLGDYAKIVFGSAVTPLNNANSANYVVRYAIAAEQDNPASYTTIALSQYTKNYAVTDGVGIFPVNASHDYFIVFTMSDDFAANQHLLNLPKVFVLMHFNAAGNGIGLGKVAGTENAVDSALPFMMNGNPITGLVTTEDETAAATVGYVKNNVLGGLKIQYGTSSIAFGTTAGSTKITFDEPFTSVPVVFVSQVFDDTNIILQSYKPTTTGFTAKVGAYFTSNGTRTFQWVAIGV